VAQPTRTRGSAAQTAKGPAAQVIDFKNLVISYAKQETVDPLKTLGQYLGYGISGAILIGTGLFFGLLALLRGLQDITFFNNPAEPEGGTWSWMPYFIVMIVGLVIAGLFLRTLYKFTQQQGSAR
jgi:hypothetical protein